MPEKGSVIRDLPAYRDINSGAVIFNNSSQYQKEKKKKRIYKPMERIERLERYVRGLVKEVKLHRSEIIALKSRVTTLENA